MLCLMFPVVYRRYTSDCLINRKKPSLASRPLMSCVSFTCWQIAHNAVLFPFTVGTGKQSVRPHRFLQTSDFERHLLGAALFHYKAILRLVTGNYHQFRYFESDTGLYFSVQGRRMESPGRELTSSYLIMEAQREQLSCPRSHH